MANAKAKFGSIARAKMVLRDVDGSVLKTITEDFDPVTGVRTVIEDAPTYRKVTLIHTEEKK